MGGEGPIEVALNGDEAARDHRDDHREDEGG